MNRNSRKTFRRGGVWGWGERVPLRWTARQKFLASLEELHRLGWLTPHFLLVGAALQKILGADGRCDPSLATLAAKSRVSVSTVQRALAAFEEHGMISRQNRYKPDAKSAWRIAQASNQYVLHPEPLRGFPQRRSDGQRDRGKRTDILSKPVAGVFRVLPGGVLETVVTRYQPIGGGWSEEIRIE